MTITEAHMIEPIRRLMHTSMHVDISVQEFSAGYGIADIVGARLCDKCCQTRDEMGLAAPLNHLHLIRVLLSLKPGNDVPIEYLRERAMVAESTLRSKVLPQLLKMGLIEKAGKGYYRLVIVPPNPATEVVAIEAKQTKWREAILQARRYTYFAEQTYVAVWERTTRLIDRSLLYRHRLGLISVTLEDAKVLVPAPRRHPREASMSRLCAEYLYAQSLNSRVPVSARL